MTTLPIPGAVPTKTHSLLWATVAALGATTLALAAALVQTSRHAEEVAPTTPLTPANAVATVLQPLGNAPASSAEHEEILPSAPAKYEQVAPKKIVKSPQSAAALARTKEPVAVATKSPAQVPWEVVESAPPAAGAPAAPHRVVCASCGTVEAVTPLERESSSPSGAGAIAGAVLGGLVGNQFGGGDGKALATIAGVLGGGWAGNTVEKKMKKDTVYRVEVRMEDGSVRTIEQSNPATVGAHVKIEGNTLSPVHSADPAA